MLWILYVSFNYLDKSMRETRKINKNNNMIQCTNSNEKVTTMQQPTDSSNKDIGILSAATRWFIF